MDILIRSSISESFEDVMQHVFGYSILRGGICFQDIKRRLTIELQQKAKFRYAILFIFSIQICISNVIYFALIAS